MKGMQSSRGKSVLGWVFFSLWEIILSDKSALCLVDSLLLPWVKPTDFFCIAIPLVLFFGIEGSFFHWSLSRRLFSWSSSWCQRTACLKSRSGRDTVESNSVVVRFVPLLMGDKIEFSTIPWLSFCQYGGKKRGGGCDPWPITSDMQV